MAQDGGEAHGVAGEARQNRRRGGRVGRIAGGVVLALVVCLGLFYYFWLDRSMGSGPAGPAVPREAFARVWTRRPVHLLGLGDSVTAGFGASEGLSYFERLVENPPDEFPELRGVNLRTVFPRLTVENAAVSGSTSLQHAERHIPRLERHPSETLGWVVLTTGGNDILHNYGRSAPVEGAMFGATREQARPWIRNFERRLDGMVAALNERFPGGCEIFLANIYDPTDGVGIAKIAGFPAWDDGLPIHAEYNRVLSRCAERHGSVHLVDIHGPLLGHGIYSRQFWRPHYRAADPTHWFFQNFEDPNDRGYDAIRRAFLVEMGRVARERGWTR